ncbi:hypothetical protein EB118_23600 [bacterium]|nr:hypothetical protein [bacterium]NDG33039.1 hypothetical protein [bacterium]
MAHALLAQQNGSIYLHGIYIGGSFMHSDKAGLSWLGRVFVRTFPFIFLYTQWDKKGKKEQQVVLDLASVNTSTTFTPSN